MFETIIFSHNDLEIRNIVYEALTNLGYKITTVPAQNDVSKLLDKARPDYIFLDSLLCDIPAEVLIQKIKTIDENIQVILLDTKEQTPQVIIENMLKIIREKSSPGAGLKDGRRILFKANILVVDDENECVELVKNYLSKRGFNIDTALSGEEAMLKVNTAKPDIVLLDIYMTGVDGLIVLKAIKDIDKRIIVIMTTSLGDEKIIQESKKLGADGYLIKPFNLETLEKTIIENAIKKYAA